MSGARLTAALECANDAEVRFTLWPSRDSHGASRVSAGAAASYASGDQAVRRRAGGTVRGGSDPPVRGPGTGSGRGPKLRWVRRMCTWHRGLLLDTSLWKCPLNRVNSKELAQMVEGLLERVSV